MEFAGKIRDVLLTVGGRMIVTIESEGGTGEIDNLLEKRIRVTLKQWKEKRSLDANAYFHVLCDRLRQELSKETPMSMARCKNHLIASYGQVMYLESGEPLVYKTNAPPEFCLELETPHLALVRTDWENGKTVYFYRMYRGSHTYDSLEMSRLIDGTIAECKDQGIETMTPAQLEKMLGAWEEARGKKSKAGGKE